jgi:hypothetical protein
MTSIWKFRLLALLLVVFVGGISIANLAAEVLHPAPPPLRARSGNVPSADETSSARLRLSSTLAPFRSDLKGDYAVARAGQILRSGPAASLEEIQAARDDVRSALKIGPHDSRLWLVLALLQARSNPADPLVSQSLKMSYLTGPNQADLIPWRLQTVTSSKSLDDSDLAELARSDVRAMLTQLPQQRPMLIDDYARGSDVGKKFLEENVGSIDPGFVVTLRGTR